MEIYSNNILDNILLIIVITIILITIYDLIKNRGKIYFNILNLKVNILNKDNWSGNHKISDDTKGVDLDVLIEIYNHKNRYNSLRNIKLVKKDKFKYLNLEHQYLNLTNTQKGIGGSNIYEKLKFITLLPYEVKDFQVKIKLTKEEFLNIKKYPIYIIYKEGIKRKRIKLNKYLIKKS